MSVDRLGDSWSTVSLLSWIGTPLLDMIGTAVWVAIWPDGNPVADYVMFALGVAIAVLFIQRVMYYLKRSRMEMYLHPTI